MKKILVVDDSRTVRTMCEWIYKGLEDKVLTAESAASARSILASESVDIAVVDYTLPDADSYEFISSLRGKTRAVALGGTYAEFDADKARAAGASGVLIKPFKTAEFFETMEVAMAQPLSQSAPEPQASESAAPAPSFSKISSSQFARVSSQQGISPAQPPQQAAPISGLNAVTTASGLHSRRFNFPGASSSPQIPVAKPQGDSATPKTPVPSVSPAVASAGSGQVQIDPAVLRAEVIAAVKQMLPAIVSSYLKKLIQAEVKPQLQTWVDTRVEALIKKMIQQ